MALVHPLSSECVSSTLDLFSVPPTLGTLENGFWVDYTPLSSFSTPNAPLEFTVSGNGEYYLDLANSFLYLRVKVTKQDGTALDEACKVAPVNSFMHSLFQQCDVFLNDKQVSSAENTYPYRSYMETLLSYNSESKSTHLASELFFRDEAEKIGDNDPTIAGANLGLKSRQRYIAGSKSVDLMGKLHGDLFCQERYILNSVDLKIKLIRSKPDFALMSPEADANYNIIIENATLYVRQVSPNASLLLSHAKALEQGNARYPIRRVEVKTITIPQGMSSLSQNHLYLGGLPKRIILGCVENQSFNGSYAKNPFQFHHYNINFLSLYLNGSQVPLKPLQPDFERDLYIRSYSTLFSGCSMLFDNKSHGISRKDYKNGYTLFAFDLTPTLEQGDFFSLVKEGNLRLEMKFATPLEHSINVIVYGEHEAVIEIDKARNVYADF